MRLTPSEAIGSLRRFVTALSLTLALPAFAADRPAVEPIDVGIDHLLAQIGRGVDQNARYPRHSIARLRGRDE